MSLVYMPSRLGCSRPQQPTQDFHTVYFKSDNADMNIQVPTFGVAHLVRAYRLAAPFVETHAKIS
jgi:hypothetical protein